MWLPPSDAAWLHLCTPFTTDVCAGLLCGYPVDLLALMPHVPMSLCAQTGVTAELGNVTPFIIVPGQWTDKEISLVAANVSPGFYSIVNT